MVLGRTKGLTFRGKGNVVLVAAQLDDADGNPTEEYVLLRADENGRLRTIAAGAGAAFLGLTDTPGSYVGQALEVLRVNAAADAVEFAAASALGLAHNDLTGITVPQHHSSPFPRINDAGLTTWVVPGWSFRGRNTQAIAIDTLYFVPIRCERARTFTAIGIHVNGPGAGGTVARLGIYAATFDGNGDLTPDALTLDAGTVPVDVNGEKVIVISETLGEGYHFLAYSTDAAPSLRGLLATNAINMPTVGRGAAVDAGQQVIPLVGVVDGAAALPDPAPTPTGGTVYEFEAIALRQ